METLTLHGVTPGKLNAVRSSFEAKGYTVTTAEQGDGNFTVVATKPSASTKASLSAVDSKPDTIVLHNVPANSLSKVVSSMTAKGYSVSVQAEDDGEFTVIGTKK